ncbi:MAG: glycosyltransferase [Pyrinomonadaceae bacterium]|nr:glycosyltransferase [Pyrinomonadaceae bacterium]MCX7640177.1 glycosyltransferase [Pyrinomonadaceae bacterium]MDW8303235.1 glycosyltransferase [Acidobacteriota bacterium]
MTIKTVHLTNYYHSNSGGVSTSLNNLLKAAEKKKRPISLIVPGEKDSVISFNEYAKIYYVRAIRSPFFDRSYRLIMPWKYTFKNSSVRRILLEEKPDLIEVTDKYTLIFLGLMIRKGFFSSLGRPILVHFSAERMDDNVAVFLTKKEVGKKFSRNYVANILLPFFDFHIANSEYTASELFEAEAEASKWLLKKTERIFSTPKIPLKERVFICPRGVDLSLFSITRKSEEKKRQILKQYDLPTERKLLFYAGRLSPEKNLDLLLKTLKALTEKNFTLLVAGSGPKRKWLEEEAKKFADKSLILVGHLDKERLADFYANVDVFIHPNPHEPFGNTVLEAMASGCPVVAPNSGGVLTYSNQDNAWLVEPTPQAFSNVIEKIFQNGELRTSKIKKALETAKENSSENAVNRLLSTYEKIYETFIKNRNAFEVAKLFLMCFHFLV